VTRYVLPISDKVLGLKEHKHGNIVRYEDVKPVIAELRRKLDKAEETLRKVSADVLAASEVCRASGLLPNTCKELRGAAGEIDDTLRDIANPQPEQPVEEKAPTCPKCGEEMMRMEGHDQWACTEIHAAKPRSDGSLRRGVWPAEMGQAIVDNRRAITKLGRRLDAADIPEVGV
jgi:ribosomal protein S27AE